MRIESSTLDLRSAYKLLTGSVIPRPIAWVTSRSKSDVVNLAPFSQFTILSYAPPIVGFVVGHKGRVQKDTLRNVRERGEFVVNIPSFAMMSNVHGSAIEFDADTSEADEFRIELIDLGEGRTPGVADAKIRMECVLYRTDSFGNDQSVLISGSVKAFHVEDDIVDNLRIDARKLDPLSRLGGPSYARIGDFTLLSPIGATPAEVVENGTG